MIIRGDLIIASLTGDSGKPRPALVILANAFGALDRLVVLPLSSTLLPGVPLTRIDIAPDARNGLRLASQILLHRIATLPRAKAGAVTGHVDGVTMLVVNRALVVFLGLA